jgi:hypothetical protein
MLDAYRDLIEELTGTPTALRQALDARAVPAPAVAAALIAELRDRDRAVHDRLQTMLRQRDPVLKPFPASSDAGEANAEAALAGFNAIRGELVSLLMNLTLRDWERTAIDQGGDEVTVADEVERHVEFDEDHRARILEGLRAEG